MYTDQSAHHLRARDKVKAKAMTRAMARARAKARAKAVYSKVTGHSFSIQCLQDAL